MRCRFALTVLGDASHVAVILNQLVLWVGVGNAMFISRTHTGKNKDLNTCYRSLTRVRLATSSAVQSNLEVADD